MLACVSMRVRNRKGGLALPLFGPPNVEKLKAQHNVMGLMKALSYFKNYEVQRQAAAAMGQIGDALAAESLALPHVLGITPDSLVLVCGAKWLNPLEKPI
jgi:hypothetical protein